jgi:hypothetical protein
LARALAKDPAQRYATASAFVEALAGTLAGKKIRGAAAGPVVLSAEPQTIVKKPAAAPLPAVAGAVSQGKVRAPTPPDTAKPPKATTPPGGSERARRRSPAWIWILGALAVLMLAIGLGALLRGGKAEPTPPGEDATVTLVAQVETKSSAAPSSVATLVPTQTPAPLPTEPPGPTWTPVDTVPITPMPTATYATPGTPTATASATLAPSPTSSPIPTVPSPSSTPKPSPTKPSPTPKTPEATSPKPSYPAPILVSPDNGAGITGRATFVWAWPGPSLAANQGFEVRIWKDGQPDHYGAAGAVRETRIEIELGSAYGVQQGGGGDYFWTVAVVEIDPYKRIGPEAAPRTLVIGVGGDSNPTDAPP